MPDGLSYLLSPVVVQEKSEDMVPPIGIGDHVNKQLLCQPIKDMLHKHRRLVEKKSDGEIGSPGLVLVSGQTTRAV